MWSWDSALIALGLAQLSVPRAVTELRTLLRAQWSTGMIPHIVFSEGDGYFPGPERWGTQAAAAETFGAWLAWHRWLGTARDPDRRGLVEIYHGWESGMDNSPRWDRPYAAVVPGAELPSFVRTDVDHVGDASVRPTDAEYGRYLWLIEQLRRVGYDDDAARDVVGFRVADVFTSAILAVASDELSSR